MADQTVCCRCLNWICPRGCSRLLLVLWATLLVADGLKHLAILGADAPPPQLDAHDYWRLAGQLADGDWFLAAERGAFRTPGLPLFAAPFRLALGTFALQATLAAQHLVVMATALLTAAICGRLTSSSWFAWMGYAIAACGVSRDWHANLILSENLFTLLLLAAVAGLIWCLGKPSVTAAISTGALIGLATLVRPISTYLWAPFAATLVFAVLPWCRQPAVSSNSLGTRLIAAVSRGAFMTAAVYAVLSPWLVRNQVLFGSPFMTQFLGRNLWVVTFEEQSGSGLTLGDGPRATELQEHLDRIDIPVDLRDTWSVSDALTAGGLPDDQIDRLMLQVCREEISKARATVAYKTIRRTANFWRCVSNPFPFYDWRPGQASYEGQRVWKSARLAEAYRKVNAFAASRSLRMNELLIACVLIALLSLFRSPQTRAVAFGFGLTLLYFNLVTAALEIESYRYRMILEPIMIASVVAGIGSWTRTAHAQDREARDDG